MIGILPNSNDFSHPQDRRRYLYYLESNNIEYELADFSKVYEVLYVSLNCDLNLWSQYKKINNLHHVKIIFDLSDNYLADTPVRSFLRSIGHFLIGRTRSLCSSYKKSILKMLEVADIVTAGSDEQREVISRYTRAKVIVARDYFFEFDEYLPIHKSTTCDDEVSIVWEGFSHSLFKIYKFFWLISSGQRLKGVKKVSLYFVTDTRMCRFFGSVLCTSAERHLSKKLNLDNVTVSVLDWTVENLVDAVSKSDFAIIPLPNDPISRSKPENKVMLFYYLKIPVLCSDIPSYRRVMQDSFNEKFICSSILEWEGAIELLKYDNDKYIQNSSKYVAEKLSMKNYIEFWSKIFL